MRRTKCIGYVVLAIMSFDIMSLCIRYKGKQNKNAFNVYRNIECIKAVHHGCYFFHGNSVKILGNNLFFVLFFAKQFSYENIPYPPKHRAWFA
jgi:hypothetical protein